MEEITCPCCHKNVFVDNCSCETICCPNCGRTLEIDIDDNEEIIDELDKEEK